MSFLSIKYLSNGTTTSQNLHNSFEEGESFNFPNNPSSEVALHVLFFVQVSWVSIGFELIGVKQIIANIKQNKNKKDSRRKNIFYYYNNLIYLAVCSLKF